MVSSVSLRITRFHVWLESLPMPKRRTYIHHSFINLFGYIKICVNVRLFCRVRNRYTLIRCSAVTVIAIKRSLPAALSSTCTSKVIFINLFGYK